MQGTETHHYHHHSDTEVTGNDRSTNFSGLNKRGGESSARSNNHDSTGNSNSSGGSSNDDSYVEITLDILDDSVAIHSAKTADGGDIEDPELMENKSFFGSSVVRNDSSQVSRELKRLASFSKRPQVGKFDRTNSAAARALKGLKFISRTYGGTGWAVVEKRFDELTATTNGLLPRSLFCECIGMHRESKEFAGQLFDALGRRWNVTGDSISKAQLNEFWVQISDESFDSRLQTFFDLVDKDGDGRITEEEFREIISLSASANKLSNVQKQADEYAALIMEELDPYNCGYILIENLEMLLLQTLGHSVTDEYRNLSLMLSHRLMPTRRRHFIRRWYEDLKYFLLDNWQRVWVVVLWIGIMTGLFAYKYVQYRNRAVYDVMGPCVCMAKGAAETLKLNMALILLPVCRNTITWLRNKTRLGAALPFDDNLNFHKVIAVAIATGVGIHGLSHLTCDFPRLLHASPEKYEPMIPYFGKQPTSYWFFVKGVEVATGIIMVILMAIAFTLATPLFRRNRVNLPKPFKKLTGFNAFWYSHHLFIIVYTLLLVHGVKLYLTHEWYKKTTWMYLAVPITLYAGERLIRAFRSSNKAVKMLKVESLTSLFLTHTHNNSSITQTI